MGRSSREDTAETVVGVAGVLTGGGVLTFALFPFLLPTVVLLGILALPLLPLAVVGALLAAIYLLLRGAFRLLPISRGAGGRAERRLARSGRQAPAPGTRSASSH